MGSTWLDARDVRAAGGSTGVMVTLGVTAPAGARMAHFHPHVGPAAPSGRLLGGTVKLDALAGRCDARRTIDSVYLHLS